MARYQIIDEPATKPWGEKIIVNPIIILLAAIIVPLFWNPPYVGRFWMPMVWLAVNGIALGSASLTKELTYMVLGIIALAGVVIGATAASNLGLIPSDMRAVAPYTQIVLFAVFVFTMYMVIFEQSRSYELYDYLRGSGR